MLSFDFQRPGASFATTLKKILRILEKSQVYPPKIYFLASANVYVIIVQIFQYLHNRNITNIKSIY